MSTDFMCDSFAFQLHDMYAFTWQVRWMKLLGGTCHFCTRCKINDV